MRRWIAAALAASAMTVAAATPAVAQGKPADPVDVLKKQFVAGHGVKISETTKTWVGREAYVGAVRQGQIAFDAKGVSAVENTRTPVLTPALRKDLARVAKANQDTADAVDLLTERLYMISTGKRMYINGGLYSSLLPDDKTWVGMPGLPYSAAYGDQLINVFEPATLKRLLSTAKSHKGAQYRGTITFRELFKLSPTFRGQGGLPPTGNAGKTAISWRITLDARKLVKRVASAWTLRVTKKVSMTATSETRFTEWGADVAITPPNADEVMDIKALTRKMPDSSPGLSADSVVTIPPDDAGKVDQ